MIDAQFDWAAPGTPGAHNPTAQGEGDLTAAEEVEFLDAVQIGRASTETTIMGNTVSLHTLTVKETLLASQCARPYRETEASWLAVKAAIVALAIDEINGQPFYQRISQSDDGARARYRLLTEHYYAQFVDACYTAYSQLESEQKRILDRVKKSGP